MALTSSLENCTQIENTKHSVYGVFFRRWKLTYFHWPAPMFLLREQEWSTFFRAQSRHKCTASIPEFA